MSSNESDRVPRSLAVSARRSLAAALLAGFALAGSALAQDHGNRLVVERPWARASVGRAGAAYLTIVNRGGETDRLVAVTTPIARRAQVHTTDMEGGVMRMRALPDLAVKPGATAVLRPGGMHIMLMGLQGALKQGSRFPMTLTFRRAGKITVEVPVHGIAAMDPQGGHGEHSGGR